ncbi:hypothetical protein, partial [Candidatus Methylomirabilis sp.]|uniref:hypothetical protein n=1 Tax=Candidatus Methylomirabilis sp. TaxID=2032687 RepID=UPI003C771B17
LQYRFVSVSPWPTSMASIYHSVNLNAKWNKEQGQIGALLRREGLYSSNLTAWRRQVERGTLDALSSKKRGPKARKLDPSVRRIIEQEKENQKLRARLRKAELIIDAQKKIAEIFQFTRDQKDGEDL